MYVFLTDGRIDDLESVKAATRRLAAEIAAGRRGSVKCVLVGLGDEIDESQMEQLDDLDPDEREAVKRELAALLGPLHPDVETHVDRFHPRGFDLSAVLTRIHASAVDEKRAVMRSVRSIIKADGAVREIESNFLAKVGAFLRIPPTDID
jgi:hypothetical protein